MIEFIILTLLAGFLSTLKGRGISGFEPQYKNIYSKYVFVTFLSALSYVVTGSVLPTLAAYLAYGIHLWTGTGGLMQAFTGQQQKEPEFKPVDYILSKILGFRSDTGGRKSSEYRKYGVWYSSVISLITALVIGLLTQSYAALFIVPFGLIVGAMRYLPDRFKGYAWLFCEFLIGVLIFISTTIKI